MTQQRSNLISPTKKISPLQLQPSSTSSQAPIPFQVPTKPTTASFYLPRNIMKVLTLNFLSCAVKACKSSSASFPLHPKDCELESAELEANPKLLINILPRVDWNALVITASEVRPPQVPPSSMHSTPKPSSNTPGRPRARG
jgi:hypothetical protein